VIDARATVTVQRFSSYLEVVGHWSLGGCFAWFVEVFLFVHVGCLFVLLSSPDRRWKEDVDWMDGLDWIGLDSALLIQSLRTVSDFG